MSGVLFANFNGTEIRHFHNLTEYEHFYERN